MNRLLSVLAAKPRAALGLLAVVALVALSAWYFRGPGQLFGVRIPGTDKAPDSVVGAGGNPVLAGKVTVSDGKAADLPGAWPQFRGALRDGVELQAPPLLRTWQGSEPRELWSVEVGEGYAGPAVLQGRVYLMDYDRDKKQDALRCLSLDDGKEIWRFAYPIAVKRNHGMSRTVPLVTSNLVVAMGPKCHVVCVSPVTGELRWGLDLVRQFGATVPAWYAGQCPLMDGDALILAPGGPDTLLVAVDAQTGAVRWQTPNPNGWKMTHSSIAVMEFKGERMYIYCADKGVVGVSARDGRLLWETTAWKISIATVPTPIPLQDGRVLLTGGYNAGSMMLQLDKTGDQFSVEPAFRLPPEIFGATQQTPVIFQDHIFGVRPDGKFACLDLQGKTVWVSDSGQQFGLGPFMIANGLIFALNDSGLLRLIEATPAKYNLLGQTQAIKGRECWGPLALAGTRLLLRDLTRLVCLDVAER